MSVVITQFHCIDNKIVTAYDEQMNEYEVTDMLDNDGEVTDNAGEAVWIVVKLADDAYRAIDISDSHKLASN